MGLVKNAVWNWLKIRGRYRKGAWLDKVQRFGM